MKRILKGFFILLFGISLFTTSALASVAPMNPASFDDFSGSDIYEISPYLGNEEEAAELIRQYAPLFNGQNVKVKLDGYSYDCLKFITGFWFSSLELECTFSDYFSYDQDGTFYRLSDVYGLTKLTMIDNGYGFFSQDDVYSTLTDLTLINEGSYDLVYGDISSRQMPMLKHLTLYFDDSYDLFYASMKDALVFPKTLETLDIYIGEELMDPPEITDGHLIGALTYYCPQVLVNNVPLTALTVEGEADVTAENMLEKAMTGAEIADIFDNVRYGLYPTTDGTPQIYGKLLFAEYNIGYDERQVLYRTSTAYFDKYWDYMALMASEEHPEMSGDEYSYESVPEEILADSIFDADILVIFYEEHIPIGGSSEDYYGDEGGLYRRDYNVIITDLGNKIVYSPYTAWSTDPRQDYDYTASGVDRATDQIVKAYASGGTVAKADMNPVTVNVQTAGLEGVDEEQLSYILNALANQNCIDTLQMLQEGEVVNVGTYSWAAAGVQQTLADFGCQVSVDGNAGPATFTVLNQVLAAFGMESVDHVDASVYAELLPLLLIATDEDAAYDLLYDDYATEDSNRFDYLRGCALYAQGSYYRAMEAFLDSYYGDYMQRADQCAQPWPQNGELWHNGYYYSEAMYLAFTVNSYDESEGMYFEVYTADNVLVSALFLTGSGTVYTSLPGGVYRIKDATGETWYGMKDAFGRYGDYEFMYFDEYEEDPYLTYLPSGYVFTISVNITTSTDGTGVGSTYSDWESWTQS